MKIGAYNMHRHTASEEDAKAKEIRMLRSNDLTAMFNLPVTLGEALFAVLDK